MKVLYSTVIDSHIKFQYQAFIFLHSLLSVGVPAENILFNFVRRGVDLAFEAYLKRLNLPV